MSDQENTFLAANVTPYLMVPRVDAVIRFLIDALDGEVLIRLVQPGGRIMHAEVRVRGSVVMLGEPSQSFGPMPSSLYVRVNDPDEAYHCAIQAGGTSVMEPTTMEHAGERYGGIRDPGGNIWWLAARIEDISPEEQQRRIDVMFTNE